MAISVCSIKCHLPASDSFSLHSEVLKGTLALSFCFLLVWLVSLFYFDVPVCW